MSNGQLNRNFIYQEDGAVDSIAKPMENPQKKGTMEKLPLNCKEQNSENALEKLNARNHSAAYLYRA